MRALVLVGAAMACACADDPGPLDVATIAVLARTSGDAEGYARTGTYDATLIADSCDCPPVDVASLPTLPTDPCLLRLVPQGFVSVAVVQSDGALLLELLLDLGPFELVGGLDEDGAFSLGSVDKLSSAVGSGYSVARLDGTFDGTGGFVADFARRHDATIAEQQLSCTERITVEATRR